MSGCTREASGDNCRRTDCPKCGREANKQLRAEAALTDDGLFAMAQEVARVRDSRAEYALTVADLARTLWTFPERMAASTRDLSRSWAEGVIDELTDAPGLVHGDFPSRDDERALYLRGRLWARQRRT